MLRRELLLPLLVVGTLAAGHRSALAVTWTGGGTTNNWSDPANWRGGAVPGPGDTVVFDGTSGKDSVLDIDISVLSLQVKFAYTGTLTIDAALTTAGDVKLSGGVTQLSPTGSISTIDGKFTVTGSAVLDIDGGAVLVGGRNNFVADDTASVTVSTGSLATTNGKLDIVDNASLSMTDAGTITVGGANDFSITGNASVTIDAGTVSVGKSLKLDGKKDGSPSLTVNGGVITVGVSGDGDFILKNRASVTMTGTSVLNLDSKLDVQAGTSFLADTGTTTAFTGDVEPSVVKIAGTASFGDVLVDKAGGGTVELRFGGTFDINGDLTIEAGNTLDASAGGAAITIAGDWTDRGTFVPSAQPVTFDGGGVQTITTDETFDQLAVTNGSELVVGSGTTVTATGGVVVDAGSGLTLDAVSTLLMGDGSTLQVDGALTSAGTSLTPGEENRIAAVSGTFTAVLNGDVDVSNTVFDGISAAGITLGGGAGITASLNDTRFYGLADPNSYYLNITGAGWAEANLDNLGFGEVGPGPNTTGTVYLDIPGISTYVTLTNMVTGPGYSAGEGTSTESADDYVVWGPLAVTMGRTGAWRTPEGVHVAWEAAERQNMGFFVERSAARGAPWRRISPLVRGVVASRCARVYWWTDPSPLDGPVSYRIVDIDLMRRETAHDAFPLGDREPVWAENARQEDANAVVSRKPRAARLPAKSTGVRRGRSAKGGASKGPATAWRIFTRDEGVFELDSAVLAAMGVEASDLLYVAVEDEEIGVDQTASRVRFYAAPFGTRHTQDNVAFATTEITPSVPPPPSAAANEITPLVRVSVKIDENEFYYPYYAMIACPNGEPPWYSPQILKQGTPWVRSADLGTVAATPAGPATLSLRLAGFNADPALDPDHSVRVLVNSTEVGTVEWDGFVSATAAFELPAGVLTSGENEVRLEAEVAAEWVLVDWIEFDFEVPLRARDGFLAVELAPDEEGTFEVGAFTSADVSAFQVVGGYSWPLEVTTREDAGDYFARVRVSAGSGGARIVFAGEGLRGVRNLGPESVESLSVADLRDNWGTYTYLVIAPEEFAEAAQLIADHRELAGECVLVGYVQDICDEFSYGRAGPEGILEFIRWHSPQYVLLLGDATFDPLDYGGAGTYDRVPAWFVRDKTSEIVSDEPYSRLDDDGPVDVAVGRLPARDASEGLALVNKVIAGEKNWSVGDPVVLVADDDTPLYRSTCESVRSAVGRPLRTVYLDEDLGGMTPADALSAAVGDGARFVFYFGHGSLDRWAGEAILTVADAPTFAAGNPTVVVALSCLNGAFDGWDYGLWEVESLSEALLRAGDAGAWGVVACVGYADESSQSVFGQKLAEEFASGVSLGRAMVIAKNSLPEGSTDVARTFNLLGDPAAVGTETGPGGNTSPGFLGVSGGCSVPPGLALEAQTGVPGSASVPIILALAAAAMLIKRRREAGGRRGYDSD